MGGDLNELTSSAPSPLLRPIMLAVAAASLATNLAWVTSCPMGGS